MSSRLLTGSICVAMLACSSTRPDFARPDGGSSGPGETSQAQSVDAGGAFTSTTSSSSSTVTGSTTDPLSETDVSSHSNDSASESTDTTQPDPTDVDATEADTADEDDTEGDATETDAGCGDDPECAECDDQCESGEARCSAEGQLERCEVDDRGCWQWGEPTACESGRCATQTSCVECEHQCEVGETNCDGGSLQTCVADDLGCLDWSQPSACASGMCASSTACLVCDDKCTSGTYSCSGSQLSSCTLDEQGCYDYGPEATCGGDTPTCNANAGRCECDSGAAPTCTDATTASECSGGAWVDSECTGDTPVCVSGLGCQACTEHSQCPDSACHLAGSKQGTCFATSSVVNVNNPATLLNAVNATSADGESVIKLSPGTYTMSAGFSPQGETALIGQSGVVIVDDMPFPGDARAGFIYGEGITYLAQIELRNESADHAGVTPNTGGIMWLDDVKISGQYNAIYSNGEVHLRRTSVYGYTSGVIAVYGGSAFLENSMIGPATSGYGTTGVGAYSGGVLDVRYSTIVGNDWGVGCSPGDSSGRIANSIIASNVNGSSIADENTDCSEAFTLVTNAVDQTGYGTTIAAYSTNWFVSASTGDLHLSNAGRVAIPAIAVGGSGDPRFDFDGDSRPTSAGFPGADEP